MATKYQQAFSITFLGEYNIPRLYSNDSQHLDESQDWVHCFNKLMKGASAAPQVTF